MRTIRKKYPLLPYLLSVLCIELISILVPKGTTASAISATEAPVNPSIPVLTQPPAMSFDPLYGEEWGLADLDISKVWQLSSGRPDIIIAVLDSGIDENHPDLEGQVVDSVNFTDSPTCNDLLGHGTAVASIISAKQDGSGMVGIAPLCRLLNVKIADDTGHAEARNMAKGIIWASDHDASIINISVQIMQPSVELQLAVEYAQQKGVLIIAASGNNTPGKEVYPATYPGVVSVSAITPEGTLCPLANYSSRVNYLAPGYQIIVADIGGTYTNKTGTSFAAPHISGLAALILSSGGDVFKILSESGVNFKGSQAKIIDGGSLANSLGRIT